LFAALGWQVASPHLHPSPLEAGEGKAGPPPHAGHVGEPGDTGLLGRETKAQVVLAGRLHAALGRLNSTLPPEAITAGGLIVRLLSAMRKLLVYNELLFE